MNQEQTAPVTTSDPYQQAPEAVQEPPRTLATALRQIGPGLILTASIVGTGELIATTNLGAKAGFALLWLVLLSCFIKVFVQVELGRYAISSGDTTLASFHRVPHSGSFLCWAWLIMMLFSQFQIGAMIGGCGQCLHMAAPYVHARMVQWLEGILPGAAVYIAGRPDLFWGVLLVPPTIYMLVRGRYHVVEGVCTWLVAAFTLLTVACLVLLPWANLTVEEAQGVASVIGLAGSQSGLGPLDGTLGPLNATAALAPRHGAGDTAIWLAAFAMIGITGVGASELIAYPYWCLEKRYARYIGPRDESAGWASRAKGWLKVMHLDAWVSMVIYTLATIAFYGLGAAVLFPHTGGAGLSGNTGEMLDELAKMYEPVLGFRGSVWFIAAGGFVVLYSTLFAATAGNSRVTTDFLRMEQLIPFNPPDYRVRWIRFFSAALPLLGLALYLSVGNPVTMVMVGGVAQALALPVLGGVAVFLRLRRTDKRLVRFGVWDIFLWLSLGMFTIAAAYGIWSEVSRLVAK